jgi:hypothetical protein
LIIAMWDHHLQWHRLLMYVVLPRY